MAAAEQHSNRELRELAHRLRNELHAISLASTLISELALRNEDVRPVVAGLINSSARARELTEKLLAQAHSAEDL